MTRRVTSDSSAAPTTSESPTPEPLPAWRVLSSALNEVRRVEAERLYLTDGCLTFMTDKDIVLAFAPGSWTFVEKA